MDLSNKGRSPFYPGQPVPPEFFTGREKELDLIRRAVHHVNHGGSKSIFIQGDYGIGKSSFANYAATLASTDYSLLPIYVFLEGAKTISDVTQKTISKVLSERLYKQNSFEKLREWLGKYAGKPSILGVSLDLEKLRPELPNLTKGFHNFIHEIYKRVSDDVKGILLILDEINGISKNQEFALFLKSLVDNNALSSEPVPLLLVLCGTEDKRKDLIECHQPIDRIFDPITIGPLNNDKEVSDFFIKSFNSVGYTIEKDALEVIVRYSQGYPKLMHEIGEAVYYAANDSLINYNTAIFGLVNAAETIGKKYVENQVLKALRSESYKSILKKVALLDIDLVFSKSLIDNKLTKEEKNRFYNFLRKMKELNVLKQGDEKGQYAFNSLMVKVYIRMIALDEEKKQK